MILVCCGYEGGPRRVGIDPSLRSNFSANPALYLCGKCNIVTLVLLNLLLLTNARGFYFEICVRKNRYEWSCDHTHNTVVIFIFL